MFVVHEPFTVGDSLYARGDVVAGGDVDVVANDSDLRKRVSFVPDEGVSAKAGSRPAASAAPESKE